MLSTWLFCPNGVCSIEVITNLARKEFRDKIKNYSTYFELKNDVLKELRKLEYKEFEENRLDTLIGIEHLKQNDFGNFVSVRFAYWGLMITVMLTIIGGDSIYAYFNMSKWGFAKAVMIVLTILLVSIARTIHMQHDKLEYFNFKLICFEEILGNKRKVR